MRDQKLLSIVGAMGIVTLVGFLSPYPKLDRRYETLNITTPCVLKRFNQRTLSWEKISQGVIRSKDLLATGEEGCEIETSSGALELAPDTITALEKSNGVWVAEVHSGRVVEIGSRRWQIVSSEWRDAPMWFSPKLRAPFQPM